MPGTGVTVEGDRQLRMTLNRAAADLRAPVEVNREVGNFLVDAAGPWIPRDSGALAAGGTAKADGDAAVLIWDESYAGPQYYGVPGHNIEPHPWAIEAEQNTHSRVMDIYSNGVQRILNRVKGI